MPELSNHDHDLNRSLRHARHQLALTERINALKTQMMAEWEEFRLAVQDEQPTGLSPMAGLHLDALAAMAVLSDFHCRIAHEMADKGDGEASHAWTLDESQINCAYALLADVDMSEC